MWHPKAARGERLPAGDQFPPVGANSMRPTGQGTQRTPPCMLRYKGGSSHDGQAETPPPGVNPNGPFATENHSPALATFPRMSGPGPDATQPGYVSPRFIRTFLDECRLAQVGSARADRFRRPSWLTVFMDLVYHDCISRALSGLHFFVGGYPGRCPGLFHFGPLGLPWA